MTWWCWCVGGGGGGWWGGVRSSDSCFPSALTQLQSASRKKKKPKKKATPARRIAGARAAEWSSKKCGGQKCLPIRRSSQFVLPYPRGSSGISGPNCPALCTNPQPEVNGLPPSGSDYAFFLIVSCLFTPTRLRRALPLCSLSLRWLGSLWLVQVLSPPV